jgi:hypothetical protein
MPAGRPTVLTPIVCRQLSECFWLGLSDVQAADYVGISDRTVRKVRLGELFPAVKKSAMRREMVYRRKIWQGKNGWQGAAWFLERKYPEQFARPEIQLSFQQNYHVGALQINITSAEVKAIEADAAPVRESVKKMYAAYRPALGNGNQENNQHAQS